MPIAIGVACQLFIAAEGQRSLALGHGLVMRHAPATTAASAGAAMAVIVAHGSVRSARGLAMTIFGNASLRRGN
jgi:hypothetical protein